MKDSEILWGARDYIKEHGWCQHTAVDWRGRVCAMGALNAISGGHASVPHLRPSAVVEALYDVIGAPLEDGQAIAKWNDSGERIVDDVLLAFEKAAIAMEEVGR